MSDSVLYTIDEARELLGVGKNKIYEMIKNNEIPHKRSGKKIFIFRKPFDEWMNTNEMFESKNK